MKTKTAQCNTPLGVAKRVRAPNCIACSVRISTDYPPVSGRTTFRQTADFASLRQRDSQKYLTWLRHPL